MVHLPMTECRRIAAIAGGPNGRAYRAPITNILRNSLRERQSDPRVDSEEIPELFGLLVGLGERL